MMPKQGRDRTFSTVLRAGEDGGARRGRSCHDLLGSSLLASSALIVLHAIALMLRQVMSYARMSVMAGSGGGRSCLMPSLKAISRRISGRLFHRCLLRRNSLAHPPEKFYFRIPLASGECRAR